MRSRAANRSGPPRDELAKANQRWPHPGEWRLGAALPQLVQTVPDIVTGWTPRASSFYINEAVSRLGSLRRS